MAGGTITDTSRIAPQRIFLLIALSFALTGVPLALARATGSLAIPHNDAWAHTKIAQHFAATGEIALLGWNRSSLVGQIVVMGPLGASITMQHVFVALCGFVALVMTYLLVLPRGGHHGALLAVAALGVAPEFGLLTTSYMTDIPALAGSLVCLWAGDQAIRRDSQKFLWVSAVAGSWAFTVREQSVLAITAVLFASWMTRRPSRSHTALVMMATGAGLLGFETWRRALPADDPPAFSGIAPLGAIGVTSGRVLFTLGLFLTPVLVSAARPRSWSPRVKTIALGGGAVGIVSLYSLGAPPLLGNYILQTVAYPGSSIDPPTITPPALWAVTIVFALIGAVLLLGESLQLRPAMDPLLVTAAGLLIAGTLAQAIYGQAVFSRYILLAIPVGAGLILTVRQPKRIGLGVAAAIVLLAYSTILTSATYSYDYARWAAARSIVQEGVSPQDIDAGFEWVGTHASGAFTANLPARPSRGGWWVRFFADSRPCVVVSGDRPTEGQVMSEYEYPTYSIFGGESRLYISAHPC